jgi:hypothetical protein
MVLPHRHILSYPWPPARQLLVDLIRGARLKGAGPLLIGRDQPRDGGFDEGGRCLRVCGHDRRAGRNIAAPIAPVALNNALRDTSVMTRCPSRVD